MSLEKVIEHLEQSHKTHFSEIPMGTDNALIHLRNAVWELTNYLVSKQNINKEET